MNPNGYKSIASELRSKIISGELPAGERLMPENRLRELYNVERTTIRRALAMLADEGLIIKRPGYGSIVRPAGGPDAPLVSFIVPSPTRYTSGGIKSITHHFIGPVYGSFSSICEHEGIRSVAMTINGALDIKSFTEALDTSRAIVLADNVPHELLKLTREHGVPCVLMSDRAFGFRSVLCDNDSGLEQAVGHLAELGHRRIAYLGGDRTFLNSRARADGFRRAMFSRGLYDERPITELCGWGLEQGYAAALRLLGEHPEITAICTANDALALGVIRAAHSLGRRVPEELSVIGFGDTIDVQSTQIELTTVRISTERFARELMFAMKRELEHPYENPGAMLVEAELVVRRTAGRRS